MSFMHQHHSGGLTIHSLKAVLSPCYKHPLQRPLLERQDRHMVLFPADEAAA